MKQRTKGHQAGDRTGWETNEQSKKRPKFLIVGLVYEN